MRLMTIPGEVLPVLGTVGLLGLWLYQQTGMERRAERLQKYAAALGVFQTYQSHNAVFNGMAELLKSDQAGVDRLRELQIYNYELGLNAIEESLPAAERKGIPPRVDAYVPGDAGQKMEQIQRRLEALQQKLAAARASTERDVDDAKRKYLWSYLALSVVSLAGAVCGLLAKLNP